MYIPLSSLESKLSVLNFSPFQVFTFLKRGGLNDIFFCLESEPFGLCFLDLAP